MALVRANAQGEILQFLKTRAEVAQFQPPPGVAYEFAFDEATNAGICSAYNANSAAFTMPGGTLSQDGVPATINPPGSLYTALENAGAILSKAKNTNDPFTRAEVADIATAAFHALGVDG